MPNHRRFNELVISVALDKRDGTNRAALYCSQYAQLSHRLVSHLSAFRGNVTVPTGADDDITIAFHHLRSEGIPWFYFTVAQRFRRRQ